MELIGVAGSRGEVGRADEGPGSSVAEPVEPGAGEVEAACRGGGCPMGWRSPKPDGALAPGAGGWRGRPQGHGRELEGRAIVPETASGQREDLCAVIGAEIGGGTGRRVHQCGQKGGAAMERVENGGG